MGRPLRILQIVPSISPVYGGPSQMVMGFSEALAQHGVDVTILTTTANGDAGQPPLDVPLHCPVTQNGYTVRYFRCAPFRRYKFSTGLLRWLWAHAQEYDVAHIHALFSPVSTLAATTARQRHLPYILRPLGTLDPSDLQKKRWIKRLYAALLEQPNLAGAAAVHFTSAEEARISERFGVTTHDWILPLGVTPPTSDRLPLPREWSIPGDRPLVLYLSRLDPKKGLDLLLPALESLHQEGVLFHFVLAGSNPQDPAYEHRIVDRIRDCSLANCTTMTGFVAGDRKTALLQAADLFVLPSYYENFGIAVAEAMAAGLPVVISDQVHIWADVQQAEAGWVVPCQVEALTLALRAVLTDARERQHRGDRARHLSVTHYNWEAIAERAIGVYRRILQAEKQAEK